MTGNRRPAARFWLAVLLVGGAAALGVAYYRAANRRAVAAAEKPAPVRPASRAAASAVTATGSIRLRTGAEVRVGTQISGILTKLNVTVGSHVEKDEVIA